MNILYRTYGAISRRFRIELCISVKQGGLINKAPPSHSGRIKDTLANLNGRLLQERCHLLETDESPVELKT